MATHRDLFARADPRGTYIDRARRLLASDPEVHYLAGCLELADGERQRAEESWRCSLELADTFQSAIIERGRGTLSDEDLLERILPDRPEQIVAAAAQLDPDPGAPRRRPFHEKALRLLSAPGIVRSASDLHLKAVLHESLGEAEQASRAYRAALDQAPQETEWRYEYARLLLRQGQLTEARIQVEAILSDHPDQREGNRLLQVLARDRAEKK